MAARSRTHVAAVALQARPVWAHPTAQHVALPHSKTALLPHPKQLARMRFVAVPGAAAPSSQAPSVPLHPAQRHDVHALLLHCSVATQWMVEAVAHCVRAAPATQRSQMRQNVAAAPPTAAAPTSCCAPCSVYVMQAAAQRTRRRQSQVRTHPQEYLHPPPLQPLVQPQVQLQAKEQAHCAQYRIAQEGLAAKLAGGSPLETRFDSCCPTQNSLRTLERMFVTEMRHEQGVGCEMRGRRSQRVHAWHQECPRAHWTHWLHLQQQRQQCGWLHRVWGCLRSQTEPVRSPTQPAPA